jgi:alkanesulfonate monooxygenase SsuD/methylene tetrahydromethanopterin reductase-like flavin-dependent oxidoreductase (luciferase family)
MVVKSWVFELPTEDPSGASAGAMYDWFFGIWERAEAFGFEGVFLSEHHLTSSLTPSPNVLLGALAMRSKRLRMGVMALTAPMYHPARIAEELAMLDQLSGGRLEIGLARGSSEMEVQGIGITGPEMKPRFEEALDIVEGLLSSTEPFNYSGKYYECHDLVINPRPVQKPLPPRWITVVTPESAEVAARRGYKICAGFISVERVAGVFEAYRAAAKEAGRAVSADDLAIRRLLVIDEDGEAARQAAKSAFVSQGDPERLAKFLSEDEIICGTPDESYAQLKRQCDATGTGNYLIYGGFPLNRHRFERTLELYGRCIIPRLRNYLPMQAAA